MIRPIRIWVEWAARDPNQKWSAILQNDVRFRWCSARTTERFVRSACLCAHLAGTSASRIPVMIIPFQSSSSFKCGQKKKNRPKDIISEICVWILDDKKKMDRVINQPGMIYQTTRQLPIVRSTWASTGDWFSKQTNAQSKVEGCHDKLVLNLLIISWID